MNSVIQKPGMLLEDDYIRMLYFDFCREVLLFSDDISCDGTMFDVSFEGIDGMSVKVSVYRELFIVSAGGDDEVKVRVTGRDGLIRAIDLSLVHFLGAFEGRRPE